MGRSFLVSGFGPSSSSVAADVRDRMEKLEAGRELALRGLLESDIPIPGAGGETYRQRAERLGVDRSALANASKFFKRMGVEVPATAQQGAPAMMEVYDQRFVAVESWVDGHGNTHTKGFRPQRDGLHGGQVEVVEERVNERTRVVVRSRGGR